MNLRKLFLRTVVLSGAIEGSGGSPAPSSAPVDSGAIGDDIRSILNFDPFAPDEGSPPAQGASGPAQVDPPAGGPPAPASVDPAPQPQVEAPPPPAAPTQPDANLALAHSAAELAAAAQSLRQVQAPQSTAPQEDPWAPRAILPGQDNPSNIDYGQIMARLPAELLNGIRSENPAEFQQSLTSLMGVVAHVVHRNAAQHAIAQVRAEFSQILPRFFEDQWEVREGQRMVMQDFYGKFPHLGRSPQLKQIVMREAQQMVGQYGNWNEQFRDALGARVYALLGMPIPGAAPPPNPAPPSPAPQMSGTGSRPMTAPAPQAKQPWDDLFG